MDFRENQGSIEPVRSLSSVVAKTRNSPQTETTEDARPLETMFIEFLNLDAGDGKVSPDTIRTYRSQIKLFFDYCQNNEINPLLLETEELKLYRKSLIDRGLKEATIRLKIKTIKRFYDACLAKDIISHNPAIALKTPQINRQDYPDTYLTKSELKQLFNLAKDNPRDLLILQLLALHGLRTIEIYRLNLDNFIWHKAACYLTVSSKRGERTHKLRQDVQQTYLDYLTIRKRYRVPKSQLALFLSRSPNNSRNKRLSRDGIRTITNNYLLEANLKEKVNLKGDLIGLSNHSLRHTGASLLYEQTLDSELVGKYLGHSDPRSTARYIHHSEGIFAADKIEI